MKRSDIDDIHVLALAAKWSVEPGAPGVVAALVDEGVPAKLAHSKVQGMTDRDLLDYGVSTSCPWPTPEGLMVLAGVPHEGEISAESLRRAFAQWHL